MDELTQWATNLAAAADPTEIDLASDIVEAYLAGGKARAELFKQTDTSIAGGFGPGSVIALLPWILNGIAAATKSILTILSSSEASNIVGLLKNLMDIGFSLDSPPKATTSDRYQSNGQT